MARLPTVVASSVIRASQQGESHGGVYLVDLEHRSWRQMIDWNDPAISWEGRGWDRGLRGIAFHAGHVYLAASGSSGLSASPRSIRSTASACRPAWSARSTRSASRLKFRESAARNSR